MNKESERLRPLEFTMSKSCFGETCQAEHLLRVGAGTQEDFQLPNRRELRLPCRRSTDVLMHQLGHTPPASGRLGSSDPTGVGLQRYDLPPETRTIDTGVDKTSRESSRCTPQVPPARGDCLDFATSSAEGNATTPGWLSLSVRPTAGCEAVEKPCLFWSFWSSFIVD